FLTVTTIQEIVRSSLVQNALIKFISSSDDDEKPKIISASFTISGIMTIVCIFFNFLFAHYLADLWDAKPFASILIHYNVVFLILGFLTQFNSIEQAHLSFKGVFWSNFIRQSSFFLAVLVFFITDVKLELIYLVYVQIFGAIFSTLVSYRHVKAYLKISFKLEWEWIKKIFSYGKFAFGTSVSSILSSSIDQMMLGSILSPKASGSFNIAVRITNLVEIPTSAVAAIVFPQSAKRLASDGMEAVRYLYEKSVGTILAFLLPSLVILFIFSDLFITIIAGKTYEDAVPLLRITLFYSLFVPFGRQFGTILDSIGKTKITFIVVVIVAVINIVLNYLLI
ncbi:MAG: flippase, partial [Pedobacter sp.]